MLVARVRVSTPSAHGAVCYAPTCLLALLQQQVANRRSDRVEIDVEDVNEYDEGLADAIMKNTRRYTQMFSLAIDEMAVQPDDGAAVRSHCRAATINRER